MGKVGVSGDFYYERGVPIPGNRDIPASLSLE